MDATRETAEFLSTLPVRGATVGGFEAEADGAFLSTLPVRGATRRHRMAAPVGDDFYPRSP